MYRFMRNMFMCVIAFFYLANPVVAQSDESKFEKITLQTFDHDQKMLKKEVLEGKEALEFDLESFIANNSYAARLTARGVYFTDKEVTHINFDSQSFRGELSEMNFCESNKFSVKPYVGVGAKSTEDFTGVVITKIVDASPAFDAQLIIGDIIQNFNGNPVGTFCDLKNEISLCEVGQVVPVDLVDGDDVKVAFVTIGGQINHKISYVVCEENETEELVELEQYSGPTISADLAVYPNPTDGLVNLKFLSSSTEPIKFYILDFNGAIIHSEAKSSSFGQLNMDYTFRNEGDGNYYFIIEQAGNLYQQKVVFTKK